MREPTEEQFLKDVAGHEMTVLADVDIPGVKGYGPTHSRCLRFAKKDQSWHQYFYITTWPGYLCINGDMGCFVLPAARHVRVLPHAGGAPGTVDKPGLLG